MGLHWGVKVRVSSLQLEARHLGILTSSLESGERRPDKSAALHRPLDFMDPVQG